MDVVLPRCAGLDGQKTSMTAWRIGPAPTGQQAEGLPELQPFGTMTRARLALAAWLTEARLPHVAMASTGASWKPVYPLLADTLTVVWGKAAHVKHGPGRNTAKADARG